MTNEIELQNETDYDRAVAIERELIQETGYKLPRRERFVTYVAPDLADAVRERPTKEGIPYQ